MARQSTTVADKPKNPFAKVKDPKKVEPKKKEPEQPVAGTKKFNLMGDDSEESEQEENGKSTSVQAPPVANPIPVSVAEEPAVASSTSGAIPAPSTRHRRQNSSSDENESSDDSDDSPRVVHNPTPVVSAAQPQPAKLAPSDPVMTNSAPIIQPGPTSQTQIAYPKTAPP